MSIRPLMDAVPFPVVQLDHDLKVLFANTPFAAVAGDLAPQLVGRTADQLPLDPARYGPWLEPVRAALASGCAVERGGCHAVPVPAADGRPASVLVTLAPEPNPVERFARLMDAAPFHAWVRTAAGEYGYANPSYLAEVPEAGGVVGKRPADCWPAELAEHCLANDRKVLDTGRAVESVKLVTRRDGATRQWVVVKFPFGDRGEYVAGVGVDVTDRLAVEQDRRAVERRLLREQWSDSLGVLAGGVAHDFNNLLTSILGNASLARMNVSDPGPVADCLRKVEAAAVRAADLCRQMLAYSGRGQLLVREVDLNALVRDAAAGFGGLIPKGTTARLHLTDPLPAVKADPAQMRQLLVNLVGNAADAVGERGGVISVRTGVAGGHVSLEVADTGAGMDEATAARVFEPFFTTKFAGRGLGLSAVQGIVRGHDGQIRVASEPGKGSTFTVLLPVAPLVPPAPAGAGRGRTVLLADDEDDVRLVARRLLQAAGFDVLLAHDGADAVDTFREFSPRVAVVVLDLNMPRLGGAEAFRELRRVRHDVKVILTSGYGYPEGPGGFAKGELAGFLRKPFSGDDLLSAVFAAVGH